jgi:glycosyltransferase involved in cell wall biosynthesis
VIVAAVPSSPADVHVAMALYGDLSYDSRVIREAESLAAAGYRVTIACLDASPRTVERLGPRVHVVVLRPDGDVVLPGDPVRVSSAKESRVGRVLDRARWLWRYRSTLERWGRDVAVAVGPIDVWHAHDLTGLEAIAPHVDRHTPIIYDSHELFLETGSAARMPGFARQLLRAREARLIKRSWAVITVNPGLAAELVRRYRPSRIEIVRNCPDLWTPPAPRPNRFRDTLGIAADAPIILFHGAIVAGRGIHLLVEALAAPGLEGAHLVLLGNGPLQAGFEARARELDVSARMHVLPAVPPEDLPSWVASADVGAVLQEPLDLNFVLSTPNKLFESIAAGTPVLASDFPEIRRVVLDDPDGPLGMLCDPRSNEAVAEALRRVLEPASRDLREMRDRCLRAADRRLNWPTEAARLLALYRALPGPQRHHRANAA